MNETAQAYNARMNGSLWHVDQLPEPLRDAYRGGPATFATAVAHFQRMAGLTMDGKLGPATLARFGKEGDGKVLPKGIDVSGHQPARLFNPRKLATAGLSFAYVKVAQGDDPSNKYAEEHVELLLGAGLHVGTYLFANITEGVNQSADLLCERNAKLFRGRQSLPPALDLEWYAKHNACSDDAFRKWAGGFLRRVRDNVGRFPVLYTGPSFWREHLGASIDAEYLLWVVDYSHPEAPPSLPPGHTTWTFRQYSGHGKLDCFPNDLDLNVFNGSLGELESLAV